MTPPKEPLITAPLPSYPWERIAADLFELNGTTYLLVVDYYSRFIEVQRLHSTTSASVISHLKAIFARFGIPAEMISDNGPQFVSEDIQTFALSYGFKHTTSSPYYPQANGLAERAVRTVKRLLQHSADPYKALLNYRATPLPWCSLSPAELLMGRRIRTELPQIARNLVPRWSHTRNFRALDEQYKRLQKDQYDRRHRTRTLPNLPDDQPVWVETRGQHTPGTVLRSANTPRSYIVETPSGEVRRNRLHLRLRSEIPETQGEHSVREQPSVATHRPLTRSQTGTDIRPPDRLRF